MPEGDTVWRTAHRLDEVFAGTELTLADLRWPGLSTLQLAGRRTVEVVSRGKHILHRLGGDGGVPLTIHSHLRMDGQWRVQPAASRVPAAHEIRAVLGTARYTAIGRLLGMLDVVRTSDEPTLVGHLGPDLLGPDWDAARAVANLRSAGAASRDLAIGPALLDQRNLAGIGTMWAAESLFLERINPLTPVADLTDDRLRALVVRAQRLVDANRRFPIPSGTGVRRHGHEHYAHGRRRKPCRRCGTPIVLEWAGPPAQERTFYFCPRCQPR